MEIEKIQKIIINFRDERDWKQFHDPKNLAAAIAIEAAELQEIFLWKKDQESRQVASERKEAVAHELADILNYCLLLAHETGIDIGEAMLRKLEINRLKYPVEKSRGQARKYSEL